MATPNKWSPGTNTAPAMAYVSVEVGASMIGGFRALYVGVTGNILLYSFDNDVNAAGALLTSTFTTLFVAAQAGSILPLMGLAIGTTASGTTAGSLVALK